MTQVKGRTTHFSYVSDHSLRLLTFFRIHSSLVNLSGKLGFTQTTPLTYSGHLTLDLPLRNKTVHMTLRLSVSFLL